MDEKIRQLRRQAVATGDRADLCAWIAAAKRIQEDFPFHLEYYCDFQAALDMIRSCIKSYNDKRWTPVDLDPIRVVEVYYAYYEVDEYHEVVEGEKNGIFTEVQLRSGYRVIQLNARGPNSLAYRAGYSGILQRLAEDAGKAPFSRGQAWIEQFLTRY